MEHISSNNHYYLLLLHKMSFKAKKTFYHTNKYIKMDINNQLKEIDTKNRTCYDDIIIINDLDLPHILLNEKSYEQTLI